MISYAMHTSSRNILLSLFLIGGHSHLALKCESVWASKTKDNLKPKPFSIHRILDLSLVILYKHNGF